MSWVRLIVVSWGNGGGEVVITITRGEGGRAMETAHIYHRKISRHNNNSAFARHHIYRSRHNPFVPQAL